MINGQKIKVSEEVLKSRTMREKKIEVIINGKVRRVPEHMLEDMMKFGATTTKRTVKEIPKELLKFPEPKKMIVPPKEVISDPLPKMEITEPVKEAAETFDKPKRKSPVRSKAKK